MNSFKKFALITLISAGAASPLVAHAASNNEDGYKSAPMKVATATTTKAQAGLGAIDKNHDGAISLKEFEASNPKEAAAQAKEKFASLDKNKDHKLSAEEYGTSSVQ